MGTSGAKAIVYVGIRGAGLGHVVASHFDVEILADLQAVADRLGQGGVAALAIEVESAHADMQPWFALGHNYRVPVVVVIAVEYESQLISLMEAGASDFLVLPHFRGAAAVFSRLVHDCLQTAAREAVQTRLNEATAALLGLANSHVLLGPVEAFLRAVNQTAVRGLGISRCGIWLTDRGSGNLILRDWFDGRTSEHARGRRLDGGSVAYLQALTEQRVLAIDDCRNDPRAQEIRDSYLVPEGIESTLDVGLRRQGELIGVICCESRVPRQWSTTEQVFAGALADAVALTLESHERAQLTEALTLSEQRFREFFERSSDCIVVYRVETDGRMICEDVNPAAEAISAFRRADVINKEIQDIYGALNAARIRRRYAQILNNEAPDHFQHELELPGGTRIFHTAVVQMTATPPQRRFATVARDLTKERNVELMQRELESRLAATQRAESLSTLANHIAHDVNNLLAVITSHASRLSGSSAEALLQATSRGRALTQRILSFGKGQPEERRALELAPLVCEVAALLSPTAPGLEVVQQIEASLPSVIGDTAQLHQALINLATNAIKAMPTTGTLTLALRSAEHAGGPRKGHWVQLSVSDTGPGMPESARQVLVGSSPMPREGGLGLTVVRSVVTGHHGLVDVNTPAGGGTEVVVWLKATDPARPGSGQHLMLVDDHPGMARVSAKLLELLGYRTTVFEDPLAALQAFRATPTAFDVVLTDLTMPQMSGEALSRALLEVRPDVPILLTSGLGADVDMRALQQLGVKGLLVKPWRVEDAVAALQRVLA